MKAKLMQQTIEIPEGVEVKIENSTVNVKGAKGELKRELRNPKVKLEVKEKNVVLSSKEATKREKTIIGTFKSHINNMIDGVVNGVVYKLKICSGHFPMTVAVENNAFVVKNLFGERVPRVLPIKEGASVKVDNDSVVVEGIDKELIGQTAANIEKLCKTTKRDRRIFQDGIYIVEKNGKEVE
jgi:large subunit ribosomal protein L6